MAEVTSLREINKYVISNFNKKFGEIFNKRKVDWNEHIEPMFRYLKTRILNCKNDDLDSYEQLTNDTCTKLAKFSDLEDKIDSATEEVLEKIHKRREDATKKSSETRIKLGPFEAEKKGEKFPPE
jgi:hypothetical protein